MNQTSKNSAVQFIFPTARSAAASCVWRGGKRKHQRVLERVQVRCITLTMPAYYSPLLYTSNLSYWPTQYIARVLVVAGTHATDPWCHHTRHVAQARKKCTRERWDHLKCTVTPRGQFDERGRPFGGRPGSIPLPLPLPLPLQLPPPPIPSAKFNCVSPVMDVGV